MRIDSRIVNRGNYKFYHIIYPLKTDSVVNLKEKGLIFENCLRWQLRTGKSNFGEQIIFNSFQWEDPPIERETNQDSKKHYFIEQYLPVNDGIFFTKLCMNVFENVLRLEEEISDLEFKEIINEEKRRLENETKKEK